MLELAEPPKPRKSIDPRQLTPEQKSSWARQYLKERERGRTDLLWLCHHVLNYPDVDPVVHGPVIAHLQQFRGREEYIDPGTLRIVCSEPRCGFHQTGDPKCKTDCFGRSHWTLPGPHFRMLLDPRGHYKTSVATIAHGIQWILNYPDIRIALSVASFKPRGVEIITEIEDHFRHNGIFRFLYPEWCPPDNAVGSWGNQDSFEVPNRRVYRNAPTVTLVSIGNQSTGSHFDVIKNSDLVTEQNVKTDTGLSEVKSHFKHMIPLLERGSVVDGRETTRGWMDLEGTIYHHCLAGDTPILMADWSHKKIKDVQIGDVVVGWELEKDGRRILKPSPVTATGMYKNEPVIKYTMESGQSVTCTKDHRWWKGAWWNKTKDSNEYAPLGSRRNRLSGLRRLLSPLELDSSRDAQWLAGMYDGEGSFNQNKATDKNGRQYPSGNITISQSMHNPEVLAEIGSVLKRLGFEYSENWAYEQISLNGTICEDRCVFRILGGWSERYRFLAQVRPVRGARIAHSLYGLLMTQRDDMATSQDVGHQDVYWFQSDTGNYIANGFCSKNSDLYCEELDKDEARRKQGQSCRWSVLRRDAIVDEANHITLFPKMFPWSELMATREDMDEYTFNCQYRLNPHSRASGLADRLILFPYQLVQQLMLRYRMIKCTIDLAGMEEDSTGCNSSLCVCGHDRDGRCDVLEAVVDRLSPPDVIDHMFRIDQKYAQGYRKVVFQMEKAHHAQVLLHYIREEEKRNVKLNLVAIPRDQTVSKINRIWGLATPFRKGLIRFADNIACIDHIEKEVTRFPSFKFKDFVDSLADQFQTKDGKPDYEALLPDAPKNDDMDMYAAYRLHGAFVGFDPQSKQPVWNWSKDTEAVFGVQGLTIADSRVASRFNTAGVM